MEIDCGDMFEYAMALEAIDKINKNHICRGQYLVFQIYVVSEKCFHREKCALN